MIAAKMDSTTVEGKLPIVLTFKNWTWSIKKLPAGSHLLRASFLPKGKEQLDWHHPMTWKWVEVKDEKDKLTVDLEVDLAPDPKTLGAIEVSAPAGKSVADVGFFPMEGLDASCRAARIVGETNQIFNFLHTGTRLKQPSAMCTIKGLPPGKYKLVDVDTSLGEAEAEVKAGETAKAQLGPEGGKR